MAADGLAYPETMAADELAALLTSERPVPMATLESVRRAIRQLGRQGYVESFIGFRYGSWEQVPPYRWIRPGRQVLMCRLAPTPEQLAARQVSARPEYGPAAPLVWPCVAWDI